MKLPQKPVWDPKHAKLDQQSQFGVSGGQGFPPNIPPSFTEHPKECSGMVGPIFWIFGTCCLFVSRKAEHHLVNYSTPKH